MTWDETLLQRLTTRELEILKALTTGRSTTEIAGELGISRLTVQSHVKSILVKLGVHSKVEAVVMGLKYGIGSDPDPRSAEGMGNA